MEIESDDPAVTAILFYADEMRVFRRGRRLVVPGYNEAVSCGSCMMMLLLAYSFQNEDRLATDHSNLYILTMHCASMWLRYKPRTFFYHAPFFPSAKQFYTHTQFGFSCLVLESHRTATK